MPCAYASRAERHEYRPLRWDRQLCPCRVRQFAAALCRQRARRPSLVAAPATRAQVRRVAPHAGVRQRFTPRAVRVQGRSCKPPRWRLRLG
jgi:hypothetical protein